MPRTWPPRSMTRPRHRADATRRGRRSNSPSPRSPTGTSTSERRRSWTSTDSSRDALRAASLPGVVAVELHGVVSAALRRAAQVGGVPEHPAQRRLGVDHALGAAEPELLDLAAAGVHVADDVADVGLGAG